MKQILATSRLLLREFDDDDLDNLLALDSDPEVMRYIGDGTVSTREQLEQALPRVQAAYERHPGLGIWALELAEDQRFLGWACLKYLDQSEHVEVGYRLLKDAWGKGYATEIAQALVQYGWEKMELERIVGITHPENKASQRVLEKCGLVRNGDGEFYGHPVFSLTSPDPTPSNLRSRVREDVERLDAI